MNKIPLIPLIFLFFYSNNPNFENAVLCEKPDYHTTMKPYRFVKFNDSTELYNAKMSIAYEFGKTAKIADFPISFSPLLKTKLYYDLITKEFIQDYRAGFIFNKDFKDKFYLNMLFSGGTLNLFDYQKSFNDSLEIIPSYGKILGGTNFKKFLQFEGSLAYRPADYINFEIGKGRFFYGNGYRSLFLSDNSNSYPYFLTEVDVRRIKYRWSVSMLSDANIGDYNIDNFYSKYAFTHYLSFNITKRINFNFFESLVTNAYDQSGKKGVDIAYFNPVAFYRPLEFASGTYDNAIMGVGLNIRLWKTLTLYSQFLLDDLIISELKAGNGWWANKFGFQAGMKSYNLFNVENLFVLGEINYMRPYTYSHARDNINYGHFHQALAHPLGANFIESVGVARYTYNNLAFQAKLVLSKQGADNDSVSYGSNIYRSYNLRPDDYGIEFLGGEKTDYIYAEGKVMYLLNKKYDIYVETGLSLRRKTNNHTNENNMFVFLGINSSIFKERLGN